MRFCVMRLFSNQVLICFHVTGCSSPSPSSSAALTTIAACAEEDGASVPAAASSFLDPFPVRA